MYCCPITESMRARRGEMWWEANRRRAVASKSKSVSASKRSLAGLDFHLISHHVRAFSSISYSIRRSPLVRYSSLGPLRLLPPSKLTVYSAL